MAIWQSSGSLLAGRAGGEPHADPGQCEAVSGGAQHERRHPDRVRNRTGELQGEDHREGRQRHPDEAAEGPGECLAPVSIGGAGHRAADALLGRVGQGHGVDAAEGQGRADATEVDRHHPEPVRRMPGEGGEAKGHRREQRHRDDGKRDATAGEVGAQGAHAGQRRRLQAESGPGEADRVGVEGAQHPCAEDRAEDQRHVVGRGPDGADGRGGHDDGDDAPADDRTWFAALVDQVPAGHRATDARAGERKRCAANRRRLRAGIDRDEGTSEGPDPQPAEHDDDGGHQPEPQQSGAGVAGRGVLDGVRGQAGRQPAQPPIDPGEGLRRDLALGGQPRHHLGEGLVQGKDRDDQERGEVLAAP